MMIKSNKHAKNIGLQVSHINRKFILLLSIIYYSCRTHNSISHFIENKTWHVSNFS